MFKSFMIGLFWGFMFRIGFEGRRLYSETSGLFLCLISLFGFFKFISNIIKGK